jgi:hypothetical protein
MSRLRRRVESVVHENFLQRPGVLAGRITSFDLRGGFATVVCRHPAGPGMLTLPNLVVPQAMRGLFGSAPLVGAEVLVACIDGNPEHGQIMSIKPPGQLHLDEYASLYRPRTFAPAITDTALS